MALFASKEWNLSLRQWLDEPQQEKLRKMRDVLVPCALSSSRNQRKWLGEKRWEVFNLNINLGVKRRPEIEIKDYGKQRFH